MMADADDRAGGLLRQWDAQLAEHEGDDVAAAIGILRCSQRSHRQWLEYIAWHREHDPDEYARLHDAVADEAFHQRCADEYERIIGVIERLRDSVDDLLP